MLEVLSLYLFSCVRVPKGGFFKWTYTRQNLHSKREQARLSRIQAPHVQFSVLPSILPGRNSAKLGIPVMTFAAIRLKNSRSNLVEFEYYCLHCVLGRKLQDQILNTVPTGTVVLYIFMYTILYQRVLCLYLLCRINKYLPLMMPMYRFEY